MGRSPWPPGGCAGYFKLKARHFVDASGQYGVRFCRGDGAGGFIVERALSQER